MRTLRYPGPTLNRARYSWSGALGLLMLALLDSTTASLARPIQTDLDEQVQARLLHERVRITPTRGAQPGECRRLTAADLKVTVRNESIALDAVDLDRRWQPTLHALVLDTSASTIGDLDYVRHAARQYVRQLEPETEKALIATFDDSVTLWAGATSDQDALLRAIDQIWIGGQTSLLDALYQTLRELEGYHERPVLVLLSDGADTCSACQLAQVASLLPRKPEKTIFTIGIGLRAHGREKPTRKLLQDLAAISDGEFFDVDESSDLSHVFSSIRDVLANEATVSVVDPRPAEAPARIKVRSRNRHCKVKVLKSKNTGGTEGPDREPIKAPYPDPPSKVSTPLTETHRTLYRGASRLLLDARCEQAQLFDKSFGDYRTGPMWQFHAETGRIKGCGFDATTAHGPLFDPSTDLLNSTGEGAVLTLRPLELTVHSRERWPTAPEQLMDHLAEHALSVADVRPNAERWRAPVDRHARPFHDYPALMQGSTFMEIRPTLARLLFLYPEYRQWALARLREHADWDLDILTDRYVRRYPDLPREALAAAVRQTDEGQAIQARAVEPSPLDLQPYLAAWLGDVSASELFSRWERDRINRLLAGETNGNGLERFSAGWRELRRIFFVPSYTRTLALLSPIHDPENERIGFWRVLLPRPSLLQPRVESGGALSRELLDLVPNSPLGLWLTEVVTTSAPELAAFVDEHGYRARVVSYELIGDPARHKPGTAFSRSRVHVLLRPAEAGRSESSGRLQLTADVSLSVSWQELPQPTLTGIAIVAPDDEELNRMCKRAQESIIDMLTPDPEPAPPPGVIVR